MRRFNNKFKDYAYLVYRWIISIVDPFRLIGGIPKYVGFFRDWFKYSKMEGAEPIKIIDSYPCIHDKGNFIRNIDISILEESDYACGLFWFKKRSNVL